MITIVSKYTLYSAEVGDLRYLVFILYSYEALLQYNSPGGVFPWALLSLLSPAPSHPIPIFFSVRIIHFHASVKTYLICFLFFIFSKHYVRLKKFIRAIYLFIFFANSILFRYKLIVKFWNIDTSDYYHWLSFLK